jgi:hypothetical protein
MKIQIKEVRTAKEAVIDQAAPIEINTSKGLQSACNALCHALHQQGSKPKSKSISRYFVVLVDEKETAIKFGDGCAALAINEKYVKEAGMRSVSLKDFTQDFTLFSTALLPTLTHVMRYFLTPYIPEDVRGTEYKAGAKKVFKVDVKEKTDAVSFAAQASSMIEKAIYLTQDVREAAQKENVDTYLESKRKSTALAIEAQREARKLLKSK